MAYIVEGSVLTSIEVVQIVTKEVFLGKHVADDYLFITACQDNGSTIITAPAGWTEIPAGQAKVNSSRAACFYKKATSSNEANPTLTGQNETWVVSSYTIRDADLTTFINVDARSSQSATATPTCPSVTTTNDDCLILRYVGMRRATKFAPQDSGEVEFLFKDTVTVGGGNTAVGGYNNQPTAGATGTAVFIRESAGDGGSAFTIAINNKAGGGIARVINQTFTKAFAFGLSAVPTWTDLTLDIASINGIATGAITPTTANNALQTTEGWFAASSITFNDALLDLFCGEVTPIGTHDYTGKNASIVYQVSDASSNRWASEGIVMVLMDSLGNWAAWQARPFANLKNNRTYIFNWTPDTSPTYDQSGTAPDFSDINRFALVVHRPNSTSNTSVTVKDLLIKDKAIFVGGSAANPVSPQMLERSLVGWGFAGQASNQGAGQGVAYSGIQIGNGVDATYADFTATSFEIEADSINNALADYTEPFIIYSSATDVGKFNSCVIKTNLPNEFRYHASSSLLSSDDWTGASIIGWNLFGLAGKTYNGANITDCPTTQDSGGFDSCPFINSPFSVDDMDNVISCTFDANSLVDLTVAGTFALDGSTIDTLTNSSGGNIILNAANGATVTNNIGPNITINTAAILTLNIVNQTGYEWRIYQVGTDLVYGNELAGEESALTNTVNYPYTTQETVILQVLKVGFIEEIREIPLGSSDQTINITLKALENT